MRDVIAMWRHTKMVVLVALSAAAYVAVMMPFKAIPIFPGFAEVRPGVVLPVLCGMLFGPAGAWGAAFGNVVGDVFGGQLGLGSIFGAVGNFLLAYLPYRTWRVLRGDRPPDGSAPTIPWFIVGAGVGSFCCGVTIGAGLELLSLFPMALFTPVIALANTVFAGALGALLMPLLYPRAKRWGLLYSDIMSRADYRGSWAAWPGLAIVGLASALGVLFAANHIPVALQEQTAKKQAAAQASPATAPPQPRAAEAPRPAPEAPGVGDAGAQPSSVPSPPAPGRRAHDLVTLPETMSLAAAGGICTGLILLGTLLMSPLGRSFQVVTESRSAAKEQAEAEEQAENAQEGEQ